MTDNNIQKSVTTFDATAGAAYYNQSVLRIYDFLVLGLANKLAWKCPTKLILNLYNQYVRVKHLDVGVGSGYFLDNCKFPSSKPILTLVDLNPNSLEFTAKRILRYKPKTFLANVLEPLQLESTGFDSIGINYLLHCLPGNNILNKSIVFENLKPLLNKNGVIFGTTILGKGVSHNLFGQQLMRIYNAKGIFGNTGDTLEDLKAVLKNNFHSFQVSVVGCVALFVAYK